MITRYQSRLSGPLLDRIDIHVEVPRVASRDLEADLDTEPSARVRDRVMRVRQAQLERFARTPARANGEMSSAQIRAHCALDGAGRRLLCAAVDRLGLSARAYHRILKVARTLADLADEQEIHVIHLAEAIQYRMLDRSVPTTGPHT